MFIAFAFEFKPECRFQAEKVCDARLYDVIDRRVYADRDRGTHLHRGVAFVTTEVRVGLVAEDS